MIKIDFKTVAIAALAISAAACQQNVEAGNTATQEDSTSVVKVVEPVYVSDQVRFDTDDPAIWVNPKDASKSIIFGTDKDENGALFAFDLKGKIIADKVVDSLQRPNNSDVEYGLMAGDSTIDIAVVAERFTHKIRVYRLPDMMPIDNGGIDAFVGEKGEEFRDLMGISSYRNPADGKVYVIVGRKNGPTDGTYLWQYELTANSPESVSAELVRKFGAYSGKKEIEAIAVDDELGYIYYCDENVGVRKYYADPAKGNEELAMFGEGKFADDNEGIAIYKTEGGKGIIFVSDQQATRLAAFPREGADNDAHNHPLLGYAAYKALETDGIEIVSQPLNEDYPKGILVAMSEGKTFHLYSMKDILEALKK
ncbi:3-phytase (myo-inositol-hexaphosphate 3-phosphohydrolase) [Owenweeksia hongkongensis DSM 17368]|uniref:3-phytase (Myo-inositol-hexaphosphate 3-phosphohydrolase) n=1 Tax=Owenweeksia hongkongensis (strain DSM 17368 / CIP 108786 / JCM 12287 / NRRL B-23963 / UST20020801) TaxID=926562 RepID=G8R7W3_OWEHD|nr:phytase [Owenweeksia hongkongensis]AEV33494.1 3-phytase (myo-inositol-hexaphosphate 3-phosphohydrolase) [Owenweeksia hongkongensis DSM 17368]